MTTETDAMTDLLEKIELLRQAKAENEKALAVLLVAERESEKAHREVMVAEIAVKDHIRQMTRPSVAATPNES